MTYRVIQWATGNTGRFALQMALDHPDLEVVGAYVYGADKEGADVGTLAGREPVGVRATRDRDELLALDADVVLHNGRFMLDSSETDADILALLESGKDVISIVPGYFWPAARGKDVGDRFDEACATGGSTLYGTGLSPGGVERLAMTLSSISRTVDEVICIERYDPTPSARANILEVMGMGRSPDEFTIDSPRGEIYFRMFGEKAYVYAAALGSPVVSLDRDVRVGVATRDYEIAAGPIAKGTVAAVEWSVTATLENDVRVTCASQRITQRDLPGWSWAPGWVGDIEIKGDPDLTLQVPLTEAQLGEEKHLLATAAAQIRAIEGTVLAPPGVLIPHEFAQWSPRFAGAGDA